MPQVLNKNI